MEEKKQDNVNEENKSVKEEKEKNEEKNQKSEQKKDKKENKQENKLKRSFHRDVWDSVTKIEKYPEMAAQGFGRAISYLAKIVAILAIILCLGTIYQTSNVVKKGIDYLENNFPEFSYDQSQLNVESEEPIIISKENSIVGYTIIDTKIENEQEINKYINTIQDEGSGIIVLKDKIILKNSAIAGTINYEYNQIFQQMGIDKFSKQDVINYASSSQIFNLYLSIFLTIFVYSFIMYMLTTFLNAIFLSAFGWLTTIVAKIKMRFVAVFNMAIYSLTLSVILNMIYIGINVFINFNIEYFQVMYIAVAAIYLVAAIFILKSEFIKKQAELMKIVETQEIVKKELEKEKEKEEKQNKDTDKKKKEKNEKQKEKNKKEKDSNTGEEPEGSNA